MSDWVRRPVMGGIVERVAQGLQRRIGGAPKGSERRPVQPPPSDRTRVGAAVLFVQYSQQKYPGALEKLLATLGRLDADYRLIVVDNAEEGGWVHQVSSRIYHAAGDNTGWEFTALDRGLALLDALAIDPEVVILVTDAFSAYGDEYLSLIPTDVTARALELDAALGWVDAWPEASELLGYVDHEWLRTSFLVAPRKRLAQIEPLCHPLDDAQLFADDARAPFAAGAPMGEALRKYLVEWLSGAAGDAALTESWHSRFELTPETMPLFRAKVRAILREHLLSARLRRAGVKAYDFRLLDQLRQGGLSADTPPKELTRWQWGSWSRLAEELRDRPVRQHLDVARFPPTIAHGEGLPVVVEGWVLAAEQPDHVTVQVGTDHSLFGYVALPRDDVRERYPQYGALDPGFRIDATVSGLEVGEHELRLTFAGLQESKVLGSVAVVPAATFELHRAILPDTWPRGRPVPVSLQGLVRSSRKVEALHASFGGQAASDGLFLGQGMLQDGLWAHPVALNTSFPYDPEADRSTLRMQFDFSGGDSHVWKKDFPVGAADAGCRVLELTLGAFEPGSSLVDLRLEVDVMATQPGDALALMRNGTELVRVPLRAGPDDAGWARASVERQLANIPAGAGEFALELRRGSGGSTLWQGSRLVEYRRPRIHLEGLTVEQIGRGTDSKHRIRARGWVENHFLVDCLVMELDGAQAGVLGMHELRPDVAASLGEPLVTRQGFDGIFDVQGVAPGAHVVEISATQRMGEASRVSRQVSFDATPATSFSVTSADIERLARGECANYYGSIRVSGQVRAHLTDLTLALLIDGRVADEQTFAPPGEQSFSLRAAPEGAGEFAVTVAATTRGRVSWSVGPRPVTFRRASIPAAAAATVGAFLRRFELRGLIVGLPDDQEVAERLIELQPERIPEYLRMLDAIGRRLSQEKPTNGQRRVLEHISQDRRLDVLVASWETPSKYHGGGVYLSRLIEGLSARHDITLVHAYGADEVGHVDPVRPFVKKVISVPRVFAPAAYRDTSAFPLHFYDGYNAELRRVVELEATSGAYDLIDYEYSSMAPYVVSGHPTVLTVHEMGYTALLNTGFRRAVALGDALSRLDALLRMFHFNTSVLSSLSPHLITLTPEDAEALRRFDPDASLHVSPAGVDVEYFGAVERERPEGEPPMVVYVGNYQHPPNVRAVTFFATEVLPRLRQTYPDLEFCVIGSRAPTEVKELDGVGGVRVLGFVEDLRPWLGRASVYVAPIFSGTGMRIKIIEALAAGVPVVATGLAMNGLEVEDGVQFVRAEDGPSFARAVARALDRPEEATAMGRRAREAVAEAWSWSAAVERRSGIWRDVVAAHGSRRESGARPAERDVALAPTR